MTSRFNPVFYGTSGPAFVLWQKSYKRSVHGELERNEWLDLDAFSHGGLRGHDAPRCFVCSPVTKEEGDV